jgi:hypothetical protein
MAAIARVVRGRTAVREREGGARGSVERALAQLDEREGHCVGLRREPLEEPQRAASDCGVAHEAIGERKRGIDGDARARGASHEANDGGEHVLVLRRFVEQRAEPREVFGHHGDASLGEAPRDGGAQREGALVEQAMGVGAEAKHVAPREVAPGVRDDVEHRGARFGVGVVDRRGDEQGAAVGVVEILVLQRGGRFDALCGLWVKELLLGLAFDLLPERADVLGDRERGGLCFRGFLRCGHPWREGYRVTAAARSWPGSGSTRSESARRTDASSTPHQRRTRAPTRHTEVRWHLRRTWSPRSRSSRSRPSKSR